MTRYSDEGIKVKLNKILIINFLRAMIIEVHSSIGVARNNSGALQVLQIHF